MKIYKKSEKLSNKLRKMISWVFVIIGILVVSVGAVLTVLLENMLIVLIPTLGVSFIVSGITGLVTKNVEEFNSKEKVVEETLKRILENPEAIEGLKENNTTYAYGLTEIYKNNLQMVKKCIDRKIPYYVYAVGGELDNPDKNISELLKQTISTMDYLCSSRNRIIRLQVKNAPVKWLIEMSKLMKKHPENFEMKLTDEAPFISQILIAGNEELGIIPTETQLQKSYGEFYRRSPTEKIEPDRDIITTHHNYIMGKFNKIPTITVEEIEEEINKLIIERKNLLSCLIGLFYLFHGTIRDKSLLDKFAFTDGNWTVKVNDFKKELLERIEDEEYSTTDKFQQDDKDLELIFDTSLLVNKHIRDIVNQTDLHLFKEILVKAMKKEEEMIFQEYSRKTKEEIRSFILTWTKDLEKELTWQP